MPIVMANTGTTRPAELAERFHQGTTAWVVLAVSLAITLLGWDVSARYMQQRAEDRYLFEVQKAGQAIVKRMQEYEQVLRGGVGLMLASDVVSREDWRVYVENLRLDTYWPGVQGVGYAEMVTPAQREAHVQAIRAQGFPAYDIAPEGVRDPYSAIVYLEPFSGRNLRAFGYDMFSEPVRRQAMEQARDSGQPAVSGKVTLVQENGLDVQSGFLMYLPVYRKGLPLSTLSQRQAALYGFVYSPFRVRDLMAGILGSDTSYLEFELYDGATIAPDARLYGTAGFAAAGVGGELAQRELVLALPGRQWTAVFRATPTLQSEVASAQPMVIALGGVLVDGLLFLVIWSLSRSRARATADAAQLSGLLAQARLSESVFRAAREGIMVTDPRGKILEVNPMFVEITGYSREAVLGRKPDFLASGTHDRGFFIRVREALSAHGFWSGEILNRHRDGSQFVASVNISAVQGEDGRLTHLVTLFSDITAQKRYQQQLEFSARHDPLTGLVNRLGLMEGLQQVLAESGGRRNRHVAVCFLDLDGFKPVNDTHGHETGDKALVEVALRLRAGLRSSDLIARLGGDEFALVMQERQVEDFAPALERICHALAAPYRIDDKLIRMSASLGYTIFPADPGSAETLLQHADSAMYAAKQAGGRQLAVYAPAADAITD